MSQFKFCPGHTRSTATQLLSQLLLPRWLLILLEKRQKKGSRRYSERLIFSEWNWTRGKSETLLKHKEFHEKHIRKILQQQSGTLLMPSWVRGNLDSGAENEKETSLWSKTSVQSETPAIYTTQISQKSAGIPTPNVF